MIFKLRAWARLILVKNTAVETGAALEELGGFLLLLLLRDAWNAVSILRFLPRWVLNLSPTRRFEICAPHPPKKDSIVLN